MSKTRRFIKCSFITSILVFSLIISITPTASSGPILDIFLKLQSVITVSWSGNQTADPVVPRGAIRPIDLEIRYYINRGLLGKNILSLYEGDQAFVKLELVESSEWVTATLQSDTVAFTISEEEQRQSNVISFQVEENAPAFAIGYVKIRASINKLAGIIKGYDQTFTLTFVPSYKPLIQPRLPDTNTKEIGPMDTAVFPIEVENLGNARTTVFFEVVNVPENWNAVINSQITLDEVKGSKGTVYLVVKPNKGFGYHFEEKTIKISMTPVRADTPTDRGVTLYEDFLVQSRGFSTPGFETIVLFIGVIISLILFSKPKKIKK